MPSATRALDRSLPLSALPSRCPLHGDCPQPLSPSSVAKSSCRSTISTWCSKAIRSGCFSPARNTTSCWPRPKPRPSNSRRSPTRSPPREYQAKLEPGRAVIEGKITLETLHDGLQLIPLTALWRGRAQRLLDDEPRHARPRSRSMVRCSRLTRPRQARAHSHAHRAAGHQRRAADRCRSNCRTRRRRSSRSRVPGNVEIKSGAAVIEPRGRCRSERQRSSNWPWQGTAERGPLAQQQAARQRRSWRWPAACLSTR